MIANVEVRDAILVVTNSPTVARLLGDILGPGSFTAPGGLLIHYHTGATGIRDLDELASRHPSAVVAPSLNNASLGDARC